jgi:hypothetical protein
MVRGRDEPLPASPAALRRLATGLGYAGAEAAAALQRDFAAHTDRVHAVAERVLGARP